MSKRLFASLLAGALMVPQAIAAKDTMSADASPQKASWGRLALPAIPHLDTIPWLSASGSAAARQKVDILLGPKFESLEPGLAQREPATDLETRDVGLKRNRPMWTSAADGRGRRRITNPG